MKLGVFSPVLQDRSLEEALKYLTDRGVHVIELGCGGFPGKAHVNPAELLQDDAKVRALIDLLSKYEMEVSALSCHGNPVHPDKAIADGYHQDFTDAILLAEKMGIDTIVGFSGCPGDSEGSKYSNWVTCPWPPEFLDILDWQWNQILIPYWKQTAAFAANHGIKKIAFEMHPGFCVYNPKTLLRLREAVGDIIGANFDPSHLVWQGMDIVTAIRELKGAIHHFHAKDTKMDPQNTAKNGVLDTTHFGQELDRSWIFRTVGYGHDDGYWKDIISTLRMIGYDGAISIEHEDSLMTSTEGLDKAIAFLQSVLIHEGRTEMWWA